MRLPGRRSASPDAPGSDAPGSDAPGSDAPGSDAPGSDARAVAATDAPTVVLPAVPTGDPAPRSARPAAAAEPPTEAPAAHPAKRRRTPLYSRLLHLQNIAPNAWQRALLGEGSLALAGVLVLADLATAWSLLVVPLAVAALVKAHDLLAGLLGQPAATATPKRAEEPAPDARTAPPPLGIGAVGGDRTRRARRPSR